MFLLDLIWKLVIFLRIKTGKEDFIRYKERFGITKKLNNTSRPVIWIHCVSVGELNSILPILEEIEKNDTYFILLTTTTTTSAKIAANLKYKNLIHQFNPCDSPTFVKRFLNHWKPVKFIICESEIWPFMIKYTSKIADIYLINARLSNKSLNIWKVFRYFFSNIVNSFHLIFPISEESKGNFLYFSREKISDLICNTKFCLKHQIVSKIIADQKEIDSLKNLLKNFKIITFGSVHLSDIDDAIEEIKKIITYDDKIKIFIVPRYINLCGKFYENLSKNGLNCTIVERKSEIEKFITKKIFIINKLSVLHIFYSISDLCLTGGSFSNKTKGSHNPLESLFLDKITIIGENNRNIRKTLPDLFEGNILQISENKNLSINIKNEIEKISNTKEGNLRKIEEVHLSNFKKIVKIILE